MDNNEIEIVIDGHTYYIEASRLPDLSFIGGKLVNTSNSSIYLVSSFSTETTYPRIQCSSMQQCRYYASSSYNYTGVTSNYSISGKHSIYELGPYGLQSAILFAILLLTGVRLIWKR